MENVPVLRLAARRDGVRFFLLEELDVQSLQQALDRCAGHVGHARSSRPRVPIAVELAGKEASGLEGGDDPLPELGKSVGWTEREGETGVDEVGHGPGRVLEALAEAGKPRPLREISAALERSEEHTSELQSHS